MCSARIEDTPETLHLTEDTGIAFFEASHRAGNKVLVALDDIAAAVAIGLDLGFQKGDNVLETLEESSIFAEVLQEHGALETPAAKIYYGLILG